MSRVPSDKTMLATERRENRRLEAECRTLRMDRDSYRVRATRAETEVAEWKKRFDALLARTPSDSTGRQS